MTDTPDTPDVAAPITITVINNGVAEQVEIRVTAQKLHELVMWAKQHDSTISEAVKELGC